MTISGGGVYYRRVPGEKGGKMEPENDEAVSREQTKPAREGWAEASKGIAETVDDALLVGEFGNLIDAELSW
ncbi:hypothetical protein ASG35_15470 [Burkholderia sp. Leaf177]|nr:hypothetical protein ASG35_15470 [Burkholderia sp. Leaf177]